MDLQTQSSCTSLQLESISNDSEYMCFQAIYVSSAFILTESSKSEGNMLLNRASTLSGFVFAVSEADHLSWTPAELIYSTDHAL